MKADRPICSLSLDLDNQWSYMKTHGDSGWESFPSYLDLVVPRFLKVLDDFRWKITVFVVGQDAALEKNHDALQMIADAGHEIGNHSFHHEPWLHLYSRQQIAVEITRAHDAIERVTGQRPVGFRGPGYSISRDVLEVLVEHGYRYDASTLPTYIGPLARAYYFMASSFSSQEREKRTGLFGNFKEGLRPVKPYRWSLGESSLIEIPVTTVPLLKLPFHFSYLLYLSTFSVTVAVAYFRFALSMCRLTRTQPSLLLHPLDLLGADDLAELSFFPAMSVIAQAKVDLLSHLLDILNARYLVNSVGQHSRTLENATVPRSAF